MEAECLDSDGEKQADDLLETHEGTATHTFLWMLIDRVRKKYYILTAAATTTFVSAK
jgi:hypothetical protein